MRLSYPDSIRIIQVPCTGRVDVIHLMEAFQKGADGVYVVGCLEGECHYSTGNLRAKKRVQYTKEILDMIGIDGGRLEMYNIAASDGPRFSQVAREMDEKIRALGPSPIRTMLQKIHGTDNVAVNVEIT
ncbi:MAG: F420-nonreducing hydrogenase [Syntrophaceae bacterium CG2_30_58_14]|nr:MAG: F420-nonreducing hydrogenase [Syntrophaceae bacterium CG2_30_58_14]